MVRLTTALVKAFADIHMKPIVIMHHKKSHDFPNNYWWKKYFWYYYNKITMTSKYDICIRCRYIIKKFKTYYSKLLVGKYENSDSVERKN